MYYFKKISIIILIFLLLFTLLPINTVNAEKKFYYKDPQKNETHELKVYSPIALLMEKTTGKILFETNGYNPAYNASTTKLLTAILTIENCKLDDIATVSSTAVNSVPIDYTNSNLQIGEQLSINELLHVLLIPSANDAANVLAEHISGSIESFADKMNEKAKEIGCKNTHFTNPSGIHNENHYSTAYDLALIGRYAMQYDEIMNIVKETKYTLPSTNKYSAEDRTFITTNSLIRQSLPEYHYKYATGLKTGYTEYSKDCIVASAQKNNLDLIVVILNSGYTETGYRQKYLDCKSLFDYGFSNFSMKQLTDTSKELKKITIENSPKDDNVLSIVSKDNLYVFVPNEALNSNFNESMTINSNLSAPINVGDVVGEISYTYNNQTYKTNLIAKNNIKLYNPIGECILKISSGICLLLLFSIIINKDNNNSPKENKKTTKRKTQTKNYNYK